MEQKYKIVIGISGAKNSGKDTAASMIHYIFKSGITNATYKEWALRYEQTKFKPPVIHFADYLKDMLSMLFNIDRKHFDSRVYKDELWYEVHGNIFVDKPKHDARFDKSEDICKDVSIEDLQNTPLAYYINNYQFVFIKLRTLLQYFGTDIVRNQIENNRWVKLTIGRAWTLARKEGLCLIPDVRFANEQEWITKTGGIVIKLNRPSKSTDNHSSENMSDIKADYEVNNNNTKMVLFYDLLRISSDIYNKAIKSTKRINALL